MELLTVFEVLRRVDIKEYEDEEEYAVIQVYDILTGLTFLIDNLDPDYTQADLRSLVKFRELYCTHFSSDQVPIYDISVYKLKKIKNDDIRNIFGSKSINYVGWDRINSCSYSYEIVSMHSGNYDYYLLSVKNKSDELINNIKCYYMQNEELIDVKHFSGFNNHFQVLIPKEFYENNLLFVEDNSIFIPTYIYYISNNKNKNKIC